MNICIISNSHAASVKSGWDKLHQRFPNIEVTFFAAPNRGMVKVKMDIDKGFYTASCPVVKKMLRVTSDGCDEIVLDDYDAFLVYGLFLDVPRLDVRLSSAVITATMNESVAQSVNYRFVRELSEHSEALIFYSPSPMPSVSINSDDNSDASYYSYEEVVSRMEECFAHLRARIITQPGETLDSSCLTMGKYSTGSTRLMVDSTELHSSKDTRHMNENYGAKFLEKAIPIIRCHSSIGKDA